MARNIGVSFNGKRVVKPGAHSRINAGNLGAYGSNSEKKLVFLGSSIGGKPNTFHSFTNSTEAREILRGGDLLTAGTLAWTPSNDGIGAGEIGFIRVENATQATLAKTGLTLTSKLYGLEANSIQAKLEDGTISGSKRLTVYFYQDNIREIYDNLGPVFNIVYSGSETTATIAVTKDAGGKANLLTVTLGTASTSFTLGATGEYKEVNKLINALNDLPNVSATVTSAGNKNLETSVLDSVTAQTIKTTPFTVTAMNGDILSQLAYSRLVTAEVSGTLPTNFVFTNLAGGANGTMPASWADKLDLVAGEGAYIIVPLTQDEAVHAEVARFVETQSGNEAAEMRAFYGGGLNETIDQVINRAVSLNSSRATQVFPAIKRQSAEGVIETLPAYFTAALVAGRVAGVPIGEPVTFDYLNIVGVEKVLNASDLNKLIESGVTPIEFVRSRNRKGFRIAQCVTTYQDDANPAYREGSISELIDFLNAELREHLESKFIGTKGTAVTPALIKNEVQSFLDQKVREEWLVEYDPNSVIVTDGDIVNVMYSAMPVHAINYILITGTFYRSILTA